MRNVVIVIGIILCFCSSSRAQDAPRVEIFAGYSYLNLDTEGAGNRLNMNGWEASAAFNFNHWLGAEGDFSGHYKGNCGGVSELTCKDFSFMGGPRVTYRSNRITGFVHGLFGADNGSLNFQGASVSDTPFALAAGGGVDYAATNRISIRVAQVDYFMTEHFKAFGVPHQNNVRVSSGVVFTFGGEGVREAAPHGTQSSERRTAASAQCQGTSEAALLGVVGCGDDTGVKVTYVTPGSPAALAGITPGDTITDIDSRPVRSNRDIEAAIAANTTGTVKIKYMIRGSWLTEREAKIR
jgi:opacity protein-like surface antigen